MTLTQARGSLSQIAGTPIGTGLDAGWTALDPTGKFLYVVNTNASSSNVSAYSINATDGTLTPVVGSPFPNGRGPQGITTVSTNTAPAQIGTINVTTNLSAATFTITGPLTYTGSGESFLQGNAPAGTYTIKYG